MAVGLTDFSPSTSTGGGANGSLFARELNFSLQVDGGAAVRLDLV